MGSLTGARQYLAARILVPATPAGSTEIRVYEKDDDDDSYTGLPGMPLPCRGRGETVAGLGAAQRIHSQRRGCPRPDFLESLRGEDAAQFVRSSTEFENLTGLTGPDEPIAIRFASPPDYENPTDANKRLRLQGDAGGHETAPVRQTSRDLTVFVMNVNEAGEVTLSVTQPIIGEQITASVQDPDNHVTVVTWQLGKGSNV